MVEEREEVSNQPEVCILFFFFLGLLLKDIKESKQRIVNKARIGFCAHFSFENLSFVGSSLCDFMNEILFYI